MPSLKKFFVKSTLLLYKFCHDRKNICTDKNHSNKKTAGREIPDNSKVGVAKRQYRNGITERLFVTNRYNTEIQAPNDSAQKTSVIPVHNALCLV